MDTFFEQQAFAFGYKYVAGVDEAGRGPLAGPVVAAACVIKEGQVLIGVNDSKQLTPQQREALFNQILDKTYCGFGVVDHVGIDKLNILQATYRAMSLAVANLPIKPDYLLVDGPKGLKGSIPSQGIVKGDARCLSIAAASVVAKVIRDRIMLDYHRLYPEYGYDKHKGYGTALHREILKEKGPSPIQRLSFKVGSEELKSL
jgi:ribonuclease HII